MAEFCLKHFREVYIPKDEHYEDDEFVYFVDLCESCGAVTVCVDFKRSLFARLKHRARAKKRNANTKRST